jgi:hypothetical protein
MSQISVPRTNAMRVPSADQAGVVPTVIVAAPLPSAFITRTFTPSSKAICAPLPLQAGRLPATPRSTTPVPSGFIVWIVPPATNAIFCPFGEKAGSEPVTLRSVWALPSAFIVQISPPRAKATRPFAPGKAAAAGAAISAASSTTRTDGRRIRSKIGPL